MKSTELRIGNLILIEGKQTIVTSIDEPDYGDNGLVNKIHSEYSGVKLTDNILRTYKFNKIIRRGSHPDCTAWESISYSISYNWIEMIVRLPEKESDKILLNISIEHNRINFQHIEFYFHQLQNLWYSLTGQEFEKIVRLPAKEQNWI